MSVDSVQGDVRHGHKTSNTSHSSSHSSTTTHRSPVDERVVEGKITPPPLPPHHPPASLSSLPMMRTKVSGVPKKNNSKKTRMPPSYKPHENTVICGRGKSCLRNPGNVLLKKFINEDLQAYSDAGDDKTAKTRIVTRIMKRIREQCPPGQPTFVKKEESAAGRRGGGQGRGGGGAGGSTACSGSGSDASCDGDSSNGGNDDDDAAADSGTWWEVDDAFAREKIGSVFRDALFARYKSSTKSKLARKKKNASSNPSSPSSRSSCAAFAASEYSSAAVAAVAAKSHVTSGGISRNNQAMPTNGPPMVVSSPLSLSSPEGGGIYGESGYTGGMFGYGSKNLGMNHEYHHQHYQRNYQGNGYGSNFPYHTTLSHSNEELLLQRHHCVSNSNSVMEVSRSSSLPPLPVPAVAEPFQLPGIPSAGFGQRRISDPSPNFKTTMDDEDSVVSLPDHLDSIFD